MKYDANIGIFLKRGAFQCIKSAWQIYHHLQAVVIQCVTLRRCMLWEQGVAGSNPAAPTNENW